MHLRPSRPKIHAGGPVRALDTLEFFLQKMDCCKDVSSTEAIFQFIAGLKSIFPIGYSSCHPKHSN